MGTVVTTSNGRNLVSSIKTIGTKENLTDQSGRALSTEQQQTMISARDIGNMAKGSNLSFHITNNHATNAQNFLLFDTNEIARAKGANSNGPDIDIVTTFAGGSTYATFQSWIKGSHIASIGTMFEASDAGMFNSMNINIWNGNIEDYNSKTLQNYLLLAKDTYANDQKILILSTTLYINGFLAISGVLPAQKSLTILFNVTLFSNF